MVPSRECGDCSLFDQVAGVSPAMGEFFGVGRMLFVRKPDKTVRTGRELVTRRLRVAAMT
jgi:hypothetical protein